MSLPFFHNKHTDISNYLDFPRELLNSPASSKDSILIAGPDLIRLKAVPDQGHTESYLECLLKGMVVWCIQNKVIQDQDIIYDLHNLLHNGALVPLTYKIEEYLITPQLKEQCLRAVLEPYDQVEAIHYQLTHLPFLGYITTSYDTCIETAYGETQQGQLVKFYQSSLAHAVDASRKKQPFILKLYGDLAEPDSIKLGHRLLTGLYSEDVRQQLSQLFFETPAIFIGFDDADGDLTVLQSYVTNGYNGPQKHSIHTRALYDGIITKPGNQSSPDYTAQESSPGYRPQEPVISSQIQGVTSKDKRTEKVPIPDTTRQEPISVLASEGQNKGNGTNTDALQLPSGSTAGHDGQNGQPPNQALNQLLAKNFESAANSTDDTRPPDFESLVSSGDFQLPDYKIIGKFKSSLRNDFGDLGINVAEDPGETAHLGLPVKYTLVTKEKEEDRALIYIPGSTMIEPKPGDIFTISGICSAFPPNMVLLVCTDSETCDPDIEWAIQAQQNRRIVLKGKIERLLSRRENKTTKKSWINHILDYKDE